MRSADKNKYWIILDPWEEWHTSTDPYVSTCIAKGSQYGTKWDHSGSIAKKRQTPNVWAVANLCCGWGRSQIRKDPVKKK